MGVLKNLTISSTGTLTVEPSQLKKWIEAHDGRWAPKGGKNITHLIASKDAWKRKTELVKEALEAGAWVVSYDWLEDSLQRKRKLAEKKYTWEYLRGQKRMRRDMARLGAEYDAKKFIQGCGEARRATGSGTSPPTRKRKPRASKSFFFGEAAVPFVSAAEDLERRRAEREAANEDKVASANKDDTSARSASTFHVDSPSASLNTPSPPSSNTINTPSPSSARSSAARTPAPSAVPPSAGQKAKKLSIKDLYHYYLDSTGFEYKVTLMRTNYYANNMACYKLSILESHTKPHMYCTHVEYTPPARGPTGQLVGGGCDAELQKALSKFNKTARPQESAPQPAETPQQPASAPAEADRLRTVVAPAAPLPATHYRALIAPLNSTYEDAWRAFRHAFRDLTLLSWEERFDESKTLQKSRAYHFRVEPFVYVRPKPGMPVGLRTQDPALFQGQTLRRDREHEGGETPNDDGYIFNRFNLPGLMQPLGKEGVVGSAVLREVEERIAWEAVKMETSGVIQAKPKKVDWRYRSFFNSVSGRSQNEGGRSSHR